MGYSDDDSALRSTAFPAVGPGLLRVLLALTVVLHHMSRISLGRWAVDVFFVLSGYWVTVMYRKKYMRYKHSRIAFYLSRYLRLLPVLLFCQLCLIALLLFTDRASLSVITPLWIARCLLIAGSAHQPVLLGPAWSLDIEMQFYLVIPWILLALNRYSNPVARLIAWSVAVLFLPLCFYETSASIHWLPTFISFFLFGVGHAYKPWRPGRTSAVVSLTIFIATICATAILPASRGLILGGAHPVNPRLLEHNPQLSILLTLFFVPFLCYSLSLRSSTRDRRLGNLAYPIYLFHWIAAAAVIGAWHPFSPLVSKVSDVVIVLVGSVLIERWIDQPGEEFRESFIERNFSQAASQGQNT